MADSAMRIKAIYCYPIKSLQGCKLPSLTATTAGFVYDRRFMLQRTADNKYMQIATIPEMSLFTTELVSISGSSSTTKNPINEEDNPFIPTHILVRFRLPSDDTSTHSFDVSSVLEVPLEPVPEKMNLKPVEINMYGAACIAYDMGAEYQQWFSDRFGYGARLLYVGDNRRPIPANISPDWEPEQQESDPQPVTTSGQTIASINMVSSWIWTLLGVALIYDAFNSFIITLFSIWTRLTGSIERNAQQAISRTITYKGIDKGIGFADVAPYMVVTTKSYENVMARFPSCSPSSHPSTTSTTNNANSNVDADADADADADVNAETDIDIDIDISRFRANIVLEGANEPFEEDFWAELQISARPSGTASTTTNQSEGTARIHLTANCTRCTSLNVDPRTGRFGLGQSGKVLAKMQKDRRVDIGMKYSPVFGRYGFLAGPVHTNTHTTTNKTNDTVENEHKNQNENEYEYEFRVGDAVKVTKRNDHRTAMYM